MNAINQTPPAPDWSSPNWKLLGIIEQLIELKGDLADKGLQEQAGSMATVIGDLFWQYEEAKGGTE